MRYYDPRSWFWIVGGDDTRAYSSAARGYVDIAQADPKRITRIESEASLIDVLDRAGITHGLDLAAYAAAARYRKEVGGIDVGGIAIATDDRSKQMIMGARIAANADPDFVTAWVAADGSIHGVNAATMIAISDAVLAHIAACFATFAEIKAQIDSGTITTMAEVDAAFV